MSTVAIKNDPDYRVIYLKEVDFERRMKDVYIANQTTKRAPYFEDLMQELMDIEALLFLEVAKQNPAMYNLSISELEEYEYRIKQLEEIDAAYMLLHSKADRGFFELFHRDVYQYLMDNQLSFYIGDGYYKTQENSILHNQAVIEVW